MKPRSKPIALSDKLANVADQQQRLLADHAVTAMALIESARKDFAAILRAGGFAVRPVDLARIKRDTTLPDGIRSCADTMLDIAMLQRVIANPKADRMALVGAGMMLDRILMDVERAKRLAVAEDRTERAKASRATRKEKDAQAKELVRTKWLADKAKGDIGTKAPWARIMIPLLREKYDIRLTERTIVGWLKKM